MSLLTPPDTFGIVEKGLLRSNIFSATSFSFIKSLSLKSCLLLSPEPCSRTLSAFLDDCGTRLVHLGAHSTSTPKSLGWRPVSEELIKDGLEFILDKANYPIIVMCTSGNHETGVFVGCLRKLQRWNFNSIVVEYRSFAGNKARYANEQFIELFDLDLVTLPANQPTWFLDQQRMLAEEEEEEDALRSLRTSTTDKLASAISTASLPSTTSLPSALVWRRVSASRAHPGPQDSPPYTRRLSNVSVRSNLYQSHSTPPDSPDASPSDPSGGIV
ncbi:hypothetical protein SeMB42_g06892 [Synchytrium endobioticum]|uniref:Tyrosine-protein phosphatase domain-containing protein n=1 Tax=Synchytrium endobioticum TaxID=286115 RepID=A0A507CI88_9FUNG|nr:hypothetical protein SeMB42_g06892 [Synchytrium endobioticum]TPX37886.1 hypothetical protein SeLEV6574_g07838 [Synchytrium endobioticum]